MEPPWPIRAGVVLEVLADLAPSAEQRSAGLAIPTEWFRWLPLDAVRLFAPGLDRIGGPAATGPASWFTAMNQTEHRLVGIDRQFGERLAAIDQIRVEQRALRVGWLFVAGQMKGDDGQPRRVFQPLVTIPVRVQRSPGFGQAQLRPAGDAEVTDLVANRDLRHEYEGQIEIGGGIFEDVHDVVPPAGLLPRLERLERYARLVAAATYLPASTVVAASKSPDHFMEQDNLVIVAGAAVYAIRAASEASRASSLRSWATARLDTWTSFHSLYLDEPGPESSAQPFQDPVESPYLLTPVQREVVSKSRTAPVTLISGAPGTGKSHTVAAVACDGLARGERVLVAAKSDATVDAILDLLERAPGPDPVVFGSSERREALAARLSAGQLQPEADESLLAADRSLQVSRSHRDQLRATIAEALQAELLLEAADSGETAARSTAPGLFDPITDLELADALIGEIASPKRGWRARRHRQKAMVRLTGMARSSPDSPVDDLRDALAVARAARAASELRATGGLELGPLWQQLLAADDKARDAHARWLAAECRSRRRLNRSSLSAVAALATALRSGRSARRDQLRKLDDDGLTRALPLWVGTLADVDDLLPQVPGLFDLVILDEASSIDQPLAATALLRGRRAVIAGDPRQLRQVSFVSDAQLESVLNAHDLDTSPVLAARLDVRRNSTFDLAAGACPVLVLNEHFRSEPHLVDFVADRLYDGKVLIATRCPTTESSDCVDLIRTDGHRDKSGVVGAEVDRVITELKELLDAGSTSVGVVTPFRAQADAMEQAVLNGFSADEVERLDLRVGTVHAFQGNERDVVIASLGLGPEEGPSSWRFVEDPHLFAVFMTRARHRLKILFSADPPVGGLVAGYLAQADNPPGCPKPAAALEGWVALMADDLVAANVPIVRAYPTGRHVVDICLHESDRNLGMECQVHSEGPATHIERHLALTRRGWDLVEAYRSRWEGREAELLVNLAGLLNGRPMKGVHTTQAPDGADA